MDFRRSAGWWRGVSASPIPSEPDNGWKPLVSRTDRASCSCFVCLCVSEQRFVTSGHLKNGGTLEKAAAMANHASTRTTQLYDRRRDEVSLDEVERIVI